MGADNLIHPPRVNNLAPLPLVCVCTRALLVPAFSAAFAKTVPEQASVPSTCRLAPLGSDGLGGTRQAPGAEERQEHVNHFW